MRTRTITAVAGSAVAGAVVALAPLAPAMAEKSVELYTNGARGSFYGYDQPKGEAIQIKDKAKDGLGARAYLHWSSTKSASVTVTSGFGHTATKDLAIPEGTKVDLQVCYVNKSGVDVRCSKSVRGEA
jgi:hypothetical protein